MSAVSDMDIKAIRARAALATPGPWGVWGAQGEDNIGPDGGRQIVVERSAWKNKNPHDSDFIATARADVPALCDEVERLSEIAAYYLDGAAELTVELDAAKAAAPLANRIAALEPDARRVVEAIVRRLEMGRRQYGDLDLATDTRDWRQEAGEEALDLAVYLACGLVGRAPAVEPRHRQPCLATDTAEQYVEAVAGRSLTPAEHEELWRLIEEGNP